MFVFIPSLNILSSVFAHSLAICLSVFFVSNPRSLQLQLSTVVSCQCIIRFIITLSLLSHFLHSSFHSFLALALFLFCLSCFCKESEFHNKPMWNIVFNDNINPHSLFLVVLS